MSLKTLRVPEIFIGEVSVDGVVIRVRARLGGRLSALAELLRTTSTKLQTVFLYSPAPTTTQLISWSCFRLSIWATRQHPDRNDQHNRHPD